MSAPESLIDAAATNDRTITLKALRDRLARELETCESKRDFAALSQRFMDVLAEIDALGGGAQPEAKETGLSDFERRLRERESGTKAPRRTASK